MLKIRLSRNGKKHDAHYKIVVCETRSKRDGKNIGQMGHWHPSQKHASLDHNVYQAWLARGAIPSPAVRKLFLEQSETIT